MDILDALLARIQDKLAWVQVAPVDWKLYVQSFSSGVTLFESYLLLRQYPLYSRPAPPPVLAAHFDQPTFQKSQKYGQDKARFALLAGLYKQAVDSALIHSDAYPWCWDVAGTFVARYGSGEIPHSVLFSLLVFLLSALPSLPLSVYQTFILEAAHGFNNTAPRLFIADTLKGWALGLAIGAPFLAAFLIIFSWAGDRFVPWLMAFLITFQLTMVLLYPTLIQPLFNKLSPLPPGPLRTRIEALASKLRFPLAHLYEIDGSKRSSHSNAYFFGLPWSKHIVIFDTLTAHSPPQDIEAVLAHELGHWHHAHPAQLLLVSQAHIFAVLALFPAFLHAPPVLRAFGFSAGEGMTVVAFLLFQMILTPLEAVVGIALNFVSRRFEWEADRFAVLLAQRLRAEVERGNLALTPAEMADVDAMADMGERLKRALVALHVKNLSTVWVDWLYSAYHHSHPTLMERLKAIETLQQGVGLGVGVEGKKEL